MNPKRRQGQRPLVTAYRVEEGKKAHDEGIRFTDNPYKSREAQTEWFYGWNMSNSDQYRRQKP